MKKLAVILVAVLLMIPGNAAFAATRPLDKITITIPAGVEKNTVVFLAQEKGIFAKHGLEVDTLLTNQYFESLESGSSQFCLGSTTDIVVKANVYGSDLRVIANFEEQARFRLIVHNDLLKRGLKNQTIMIPYLPHQLEWVAADMMITSLGLNPRKDVDYVSIPTFADVAKFLITGTLKAGVINMLHGYKALQANPDLRVLLEFNHPYPLTSITAKASYVKANPDITKRFTMAIAEAVVYFKNNEAEAKKMIASKFGHQDQGFIDMIYDYYKGVLGGDKLDIYPKEDLIKTVISFVSQSLPKVALVNPVEIMDKSFVDQLEKEGFLDKLRKQIK